MNNKVKNMVKLKIKQKSTRFPNLKNVKAKQEKKLLCFIFHRISIRIG